MSRAALLIALAACLLATAQPTPPDQNPSADGKSAVFSAVPPEGDIGLSLARADETDVLHYDIEVEILPATRSIVGVTTMQVRSRVENLSTFVLRLHNLFTITDLRVGGAPAAYTWLDSVTLQVTLDRAYNTGEQFELHLEYNGTPQQGLGFVSVFINSTRAFTISQPWFAYTWRPAKDYLPDKATADEAYIVPTGWTVASNGLLQGVDDLGGGRTRFRWRTEALTADYLFCLGATQYNQFETTWLYQGHSMPLKFFIFPGSDNSANRNAWLRTADMLTTFSDKYGLYPFVNEKYGIYQFSNVGFGGMEHQTMTGQTGFSESTTSHELSHMWWGDNVTCATWNDIWLNEGFATYSEAIWEQYKPGSSGEAALHAAMAARRPSDSSGTVYCYDIGNANRVFNYDLTYLKGGWVCHMLRHVLGEAAYWNTLATYRARFQGGGVTTPDFQAVAEEVGGRALEWFFYQWVYHGGLPSYSYGWRQYNADGRRYVEVSVQQTQTGSVLAVYTMPVDIELTDGSGPQTYVIWNDARTENLLVPVGASDVTNLRFDPKPWILRGSANASTFLPGPPKIVTMTPAPSDAVPVPGPAALRIGFHKNVVANAGQFTLVGQRTGPVTCTYAYDPATFKATLMPAGPLPTDTYTLTVADSIVDVEAGLALDGELVKPDSPNPLPSGDGIPGGSAIATLYVTSAGDLNCDGAIDFGDINPFVLALSDPSGYAAAYPGCPRLNADASGDGRVDFGDINPFVALLSGPGAVSK